MTISSDSNVPTPLEDPRVRTDFAVRFYPQANGKEAPPADTTDHNERIIIEFLAAYYQLNCQYARLLAIRTKPDATERQQEERVCLEVIEKMLILRDGLEDRYAPFGVVAQAVVAEGFTVNVKFSFGNMDSRGRPRSDLFTLTARLPIPLPPGAKLEDYIVSVERPEPFLPD